MDREINSGRRGALSDVKTDILNAAEKRMQRGGFGGFSFREIGSDVGVKSSSVHYHFPTKDDLAAAVIRRWSERTSKNIDRDLEKDTDPVRVLTNAFRRTAQSKDRMCPCTVLAAASQDLPEQVAAEVRDFFTMCQDKLVSGGLHPGDAAEVLSTITGALVVANAMGDKAEYDRATQAMLRQRDMMSSGGVGRTAFIRRSEGREGSLASDPFVFSVPRRRSLPNASRSSVASTSYFSLTGSVLTDVSQATAVRTGCSQQE